MLSLTESADDTDDAMRKCVSSLRNGVIASLDAPVSGSPVGDRRVNQRPLLFWSPESGSSEFKGIRGRGLNPFMLPISA